ncbi:hypothetical protein [Cohnella phaseoli]|uniref:Fe/B12 periplasmic-binding domain-containing protein n=1 Tax=Cohnella phaseoli TaxID=456490 RepID=A0A3D9ITV4_9BACL|nr:hypothetical protein [Cohnella phaseoli]RED65135.1 hypothetical protein DFP98_12126 [Cohnella phaseoli]
MKKGYVLICLLLLVFTVACGANNANNASSASGANDGNGQQPVAEGSQGAAESSAAQEKRIVSLSIPHTSNLLALGIKPYGAVT